MCSLGVLFCGGHIKENNSNIIAQNATEKTTEQGMLWGPCGGAQKRCLRSHNRNSLLTAKGPTGRTPLDHWQQHETNIIGQKDRLVVITWLLSLGCWVGGVGWGGVGWGGLATQYVLF